MASIPGGPADKLGNEFERLWTIRHLIQVIEGRATSVTIEALGDDERGTEFWVSRPNGTREAHQCKRENGSHGHWSIAELHAKGIILKAKFQLDRDSANHFYFISADKAPAMSDLCERAKRGDNPEAFCKFAIATSQHLKNEFENLCRYLAIDATTASGQASIQNYLRRFEPLLADKNRLRSDVEEITQAWLTGDPAEIVAQLESFISRNENMGKVLREEDLLAALPVGCRPRDLGKDATLPTKIRELQARFDRSYRHLLIREKLLGRPESADISAKLLATDGPRLMLIHGPGGCGKTGVIFEIVAKLKDLSIPHLPLRLDRDKPADSPTKYGEALELPASPSACLAAVADGRPAVLILDQLDAIRWTAAHSANAWDTCERVIEEALRHRNIRVVVVCRTFDVEDDQRIKAWKKREENRVADVKLTNLDEPTLERILTEAGASINSLSPEQRRILRSPQSLYLWLQLLRPGKEPPSFRTTVDLMDAFWAAIRDGLPDKVLRASLEEAITALVEDMDSRGVPISARTVVSRWSTEVKYLISLNILTENDRHLLFSHQSHLDYLTAETLSRGVSAGKLQITDWLQKGEQSLFRRGQLRQLLSLLRDRDVNCYVASLRELITTPGVRFHLQHLALQVMANTEEPTGSEIAFLLSLLDDDAWLEHVVWQVLPGRDQWFDALHARGVFRRWLDGVDEKRRTIALRIAESVVSTRGDAVASLVLIRGPKRMEHAKAVLWRVKPHLLNESLFSAYRALIRRGEAESLHGHWESLAQDDPRRTILLFHAQITHCVEFISRKTRKNGQDSRRERSHLEANQGKALLAAAAREPSFTWRTLLPALCRTSRAAVRYRRKRRKDYESVSFDEGQTAGAFQRHLVRVLSAAGKAIAQTRPDEFTLMIAAMGIKMSRTLKRVISRSLTAMPSDYADFAGVWLLADPKRLSCGAPNRGNYHDGTAYVPAVRLLQRFGNFLSTELFQRVEAMILRHIPEYELWEFRYRHDNFMANAKGWIYPRSLFISQYLLLSALPKARLSNAAMSNFGVFQRKFDDPEKIMKWKNPHTGGWVGSTIPHERLPLISDRQWMDVVTRNWTSRSHRWVQLGPDSVGEVSVRTFASNLGSMTHKQPERFAKLALRFPTDIDPAYVATVIRAFAEMNPPEKAAPGWLPAPLPLVEAVIQRFAAQMNRDDVAQALCWLIHKRCQEPWNDATFQILIDLATGHSDPKPNEYAVHRSTGQKSEMKACPVESSINCVRGSAAGAIEALLYTRADRVDFFQPAINSLIHDPHVAVRIAAIGLAAPIRNADQKRAMEVFVQACDHSDDQVLASHHIQHFVSYALFEFPELLRPVIVRMLNCGIDEVVEEGANWAVEAWTHRGQWRDLFDQVVSGSSAQRSGASNSVIRAVLDNRGGETVWNVLLGAFDVDDKKVRDKAASIFRWEKFFSHAAAVQITEAFIGSVAFDDNIDDFLYGIHDEVISLRPFASALRAIATKLALPVDEETRGARRTTDTGLLATVLLRLYEQSEGDVECRKICLDAWDQLLRQMGWGVLEKLDG